MLLLLLFARHLLLACCPTILLFQRCPAQLLLPLLLPDVLLLPLLLVDMPPLALLLPNMMLMKRLLLCLWLLRTACSFVSWRSPQVLRPVFAVCNQSGGARVHVPAPCIARRWAATMRAQPGLHLLWDVTGYSEQGCGGNEGRNE